MSGDPRSDLTGLSPAKRALLERKLGKAPAQPPANAIRPRSNDGPAPLSCSQELLWLLDRLSPGMPVYNVARARRVRGPLDVDALQRALTALVERHAVLRTRYAEIEGTPLQVVAAAAPVPLPVVEMREAEALPFVEAQFVRPFDLARDTMLRAELVRLDAQDHILLMATHHIASDGWSRGILFRDLGAFYRAFVSGQPCDLEPLPVQYADYAAWQRERLEGPALREMLAWWKRHLEGAPGILELPTDHPRPVAQRFRGGHRTYRVDAPLVDALERLGRQAGCSMFMTLLAVFEILLAGYSGQDDFLIGTPVANRTRPEVQSLIGFFVNTLLVRARTGGDPTFRELLARVRETCLAAYANQDLPFETLMRALHPERSLSHSAMFQVMFSVQNDLPSELDLVGTSVVSMTVEKHTTKFDLTLPMTREPSGAMQIRAEYDLDLFEAATVDRMVGHFMHLLAGVAARSEARLSDLPMLGDDERARLLVEWNPPAPAARALRCVHETVAAQAARRPHAVAVEQGAARLTWDALEAASSRLARRLQARGVQPEELVGICMRRCPEAIVALLGILKAGAAYVPLDADLPAERLAFILRDAGARLVVTHADTRERLALHGVPILCADAEATTLAALPADPLPADGILDRAAYVIYTSGSTGQPRGVVVEHGALAHFAGAAADCYGITAADRVLQFAPLNFDASVEEIFCALTRGATLVLRSDDMLGSPTAFARCCMEWGITVADLPTAYWHELVAQLDDVAPRLGPSLRLVILGGERALPERVAAWNARMGDSVRLVNSYGPTETTVVATVWDCAGWRGGMREVPIGRPLAGVAAYVLDAQLRPVPIGVPGELCLGGPTLARGYLHQDEQTARAFVTWDGRRLYRTGDRARFLADGTLDFCGRVDEQVKIRGFRVEPGEIEAVLAEHPDVGEAVVLAREDGAGRRLVAFVAPRRDGHADPHALRAFVQERLPDYMVPAAFALLDRMPRTPTGKADRRRLQAMEVARPEDVVAEPRTPVEEMLAGMWSEVLGVERVGTSHNFFELGGHSLLATRLLARLERAFGVSLPLRAIFEAPTLAGLARAVEAARHGPAEAVPPRPRPAAVPASFAQQRLWFFEQMPGPRPLYHIDSVVRLRGLLDVGALERAIEALAARHEILRTTLAMEGGQLLQRVQAPAGVPLPTLDLSAFPGDRVVEACRHAAETARRPFDLAGDRPLRAQLLRLDADDHVLVLVLHHVAADAWSMGILWPELASLYAGFRDGVAARLDPLPMQYADYTLEQHGRLRGERLERLAAWWKERLDGMPPRLELPADRPRPATPAYHGGHQAMRLSAELTDALRRLSRSCGATLYITLLAAFKTLLSRLAGQSDVVVGSPMAGRGDVETEAVVGFFVNTLVLRTDCGGSPSFKALVERVREVVLGAHAHQDMPFEKLVEVLQPQRDLRFHPLFQVAFVLNARGKRPALVGLEVEPIDVAGESAKFDLLLTVSDEGETLRCSVEYDADLYEASTAARLLVHLRRLVEGAVADPAAPADRIALVDDEERRRLVVEANRTATAYPRDRTVVDLFAEVASRRPHAMAVQLGDDVLTYADLDARANGLAWRLRELGVGVEVPVGLCVERSIGMVVAMLAILKAGGAYVPLDPSYPGERLAFMLEDTGVPVLVTQRALLGSLQHVAARLLLLDEATHVAPTPPPSELRADGLAYVMYTSGSTGQPKGVAVVHRGIVRLVRGTDYASFGEDEVFLQLAPISFDAATFEIWGALLNGGRLAIMPPAPPSLEDIGRAIACHGVTTLWLTAGLFHLFVDERLDDLRPLRQLLAGGDVLDRTRVHRVCAAHPHLRLINGYGPTENTTFTCCHTVTPADGEGSVPIGRPIANSEAYVLDSHLQPVPVGMPGELYAGGDGLARGYWNRSALTAERFLPHPFRDDPSARLYRTGDLVRWRADGSIEFLGRGDGQVKIRGFRVEPGELETHLQAHPAVRQACVRVLGDAAGHKRLVAYVVPHPEAAFEAALVQGFLRARLPDFMLPSAIVPVPAMPLTPNGKLDRAALPEPEEVVATASEAPRDALEGAIAEAWQEVLGVPRVGLDDNFFELGGHSLLAVKLVSVLQKRLGRRMTLLELFQGQTVRNLAEALRERHEEVEWSAVVPLQPGGTRPPFFWIHSLGGDGGGGFLYYRKLSQLLGSDQPSYGIRAPRRPYDRIEVMAECYVEAMRAVAPVGPYLVGGFCFGGVVAFEMARQLRAAGEEVALVVAIESTPPNRRAHRRQGSLRHLLARACRVLEEARRLVGVSPSQRRAWLSRKARGLLRRLGCNRSAMALEEVIDVTRYPSEYLEAASRHWAAYTRYHPLPGPGRLVLVRRAAPRPKADFDPDYGWGDLAEDGVTVIEAPGTHETILDEPNVSVLAERLKDLLDRSREAACDPWVLWRETA